MIFVVVQRKKNNNMKYKEQFIADVKDTIEELEAIVKYIEDGFGGKEDISNEYLDFLGVRTDALREMVQCEWFRRAQRLFRKD